MLIHTCTKTTPLLQLVVYNIIITPLTAFFAHRTIHGGGIEFVPLCVSNRWHLPSCPPCLSRCVGVHESHVRLSAPRLPAVRYGDSLPDNRGHISLGPRTYYTAFFFWVPSFLSFFLPPPVLKFHSRRLHEARALCRVGGVRFVSTDAK